jgi:dihydroorotate dehydrogenase electron transfer subunit
VDAMSAEADSHLVQPASVSGPPGRGPGDGRLLGHVAAAEPLGSMVRLILEVPGWRGSRPGQFALLQADPSRCFLPRAFSVADESGEKVSFVIAPVGEATLELCDLRPGAPVRVLGPLGNGFDVEALVTSPGRAVIVAGGVGVAPFPLLLARMIGHYHEVFPQPVDQQPGSSAAAGPEVLVLLGFRDAEQAQGAAPVQEAAARLGEAGLRCRLEVATEDGSRGPAEKVTDVLQRHLQPGDRVVVCGPEAMAAAAWRVCSTVPDVKTWFSLESKMACGVGSCHGCVLELADGSFARVCREGPVFGGGDVFGD